MLYRYNTFTCVKAKHLVNLRVTKHLGREPVAGCMWVTKMAEFLHNSGSGTPSPPCRGRWWEMPLASMTIAVANLGPCLQAGDSAIIQGEVEQRNQPKLNQHSLKPLPIKGFIPEGNRLCHLDSKKEVAPLRKHLNMEDLPWTLETSIPGEAGPEQEHYSQEQQQELTQRKV